LEGTPSSQASRPGPRFNCQTYLFDDETRGFGTTGGSSGTIRNNADGHDVPNEYSSPVLTPRTQTLDN